MPMLLMELSSCACASSARHPYRGVVHYTSQVCPHSLSHHPTLSPQPYRSTLTPQPRHTILAGFKYAFAHTSQLGIALSGY